MFRRVVLLVKGAGLLAALLLLGSAVQAGDRVHAPAATGSQASSGTQRRATPAFVRVATQTITISVAKPAPAKSPLKVNLRGPDGQVRPFEVEGGQDAIEYTRIVVLRPGQSVTFRWVARK